MARRGRFALLRGTAGLLAAAVLVCAPLAPAAAAGFFESLFGGLSRTLDSTFGSGPPPETRAYARAPYGEQPYGGQETFPQQHLVESGPAGPRHAFCVRTCDGRYFPVRAHAGLSVADACHAFCPACPTRIYYGSSIDHAVARDGSRYADLPNAYLYRRRLVANCSCNGRSAVGLAELAPRSDPTLRRGDVLATPNGLLAYSGGRDANFTSVRSYGGFSKSELAALSALRVTPPGRRGTAETPVTPMSAARGMTDNRTAQR
jgi:Protein of unknown function (DUF2865)